MNKCKSCGGDIVSAIDVNGLCPECLRLKKTMREYGIESKTDRQALGSGNYRKHIRTAA